MTRSTHPPAICIKPLAHAVRLIAIGSLYAGYGWSIPAHAQSNSQHTSTEAPQQSKHYQIPAGPLTTVLTRFSAQAGIYLIGATEAAAGKNSSGLQGHYTLEQGFAALLKGTDLQAVRQRDGSYALQEVGDGSAMVVPKLKGRV